MCPGDWVGQLDRFSEDVNTPRLLGPCVHFRIERWFSIPSLVPLPGWWFPSTGMWPCQSLGSIKQLKNQKRLSEFKRTLSLHLPKFFHTALAPLWSLVMLWGGTNRSRVCRRLWESHMLLWQISVHTFHSCGRSFSTGVRGRTTRGTYTFL